MDIEEIPNKLDTVPEMGSNTLHILYPPTSTFYLDPSIRVYNFQNLTPRICNLPEEIDLCCMALSSAAFLAEEPLVDVEDEKWGHNENSASGYHSSTELFYLINALCFHESLKTQYSAGCEENRCFLTSSLWIERIQPLVHLSDTGNLCHYFDEKNSSYHLVSLIQSPFWKIHQKPLQVKPTALNYGRTKGLERESRRSGAIQIGGKERMEIEIEIEISALVLDFHVGN